MLLSDPDMPIINSLAALLPAMTAWRRDLHAHPELSMQEARTAQWSF